jgi:hypothetical protein
MIRDLLLSKKTLRRFDMKQDFKPFFASAAYCVVFLAVLVVFPFAWLYEKAAAKKEKLLPVAKKEDAGSQG